MTDTSTTEQIGEKSTSNHTPSPPIYDEKPTRERTRTDPSSVEKGVPPNQHQHRHSSRLDILLDRFNTIFHFNKKSNAEEEKMNDLKKQYSLEDHKLTVSEICDKYGIDRQSGMSQERAQQIINEHGQNLLTPPKEDSELIKFLKILANGFSILLTIGGVISLIGFFVDPEGDMTNLYIAIVLLLVVIITAIFTYIQEKKSTDIMNSFKNFIPQKAKVLRNGEWQIIAAEDLVLGDLIELDKGGHVPADIRIIECHGLKVDNAPLTGESEAQSRTVDCTHEDPAETGNLAFFGTSAVEGAAVGVVVKTGDHTMIGRIAGLAGNTDSGTTPIGREIRHFVFIITSIAILIGITFFILSLVISSGDFIASLVLMIGIIVANVPEGLLATVTVSLTLSAKRMAHKKVLVKNLHAVETLGSTSVICSDKTGTLTQNRMTVAHMWFDNTIFDCDTHGGLEGHTFSLDSPTFQSLLRVATLCSRTNFDPHDLDKPIIERNTFGDASESAILKFCETIRPVKESRDVYPKKAEIPFNSSNKYQVSVHLRSDEAEPLLLVMKGAAERVIEYCTTILCEGKIHPLNAEWKQKLLKAYENLGGKGERVLGFCTRYLDLERDHHFDEDHPDIPLRGLTFVGLMALIDPPRPGVPEAVGECQQAGIKVVMVTGDHPITAKAIAQEVNIITEKDVDDVDLPYLAARRQARRNSVESFHSVHSFSSLAHHGRRKKRGIVVHGNAIEELTPHDWEWVLSHNEVVFARTSPQQKLLIVEANQSRGDIVAVTGDGVNDSPALKRADIGIAMGIMGSDVSKEAADMILLDDNFATIVNGVREGRVIFDNLKKSIAYTVSSNVPEVIPFLLLITIRIPLPLTIVLILAIDIGLDMYPAISLAHEKAESDIMKRPPRDARKDRLVTWKLIAYSYLQIGVVITLACLFSYFWVFWSEGFSPSSLPGLSAAFNDKNEIVNGFNYEDRQIILKKAQAAYFLAFVIVKWANLIVCKTRKLSLFQQGILGNRQLIYALIFVTLLSAIIVYVPYIDTVFGTHPLDPKYLWTALPFFAFVFFYDEVRKFFIRKNPKGIVAQLTDY